MGKLNENGTKIFRFRYFKRIIKIFIWSKIYMVNKKASSLKSKILVLKDMVRGILRRVMGFTNILKIKNFSRASFVVLVIFLLIAGYLLGARFSFSPARPMGEVNSAQSSKQDKAGDVVGGVSIEQTFTVFGQDKEGKKKGELKTTLTRAEKTNKVAVGEKILDISKEPRFVGQIFLLVFIEIENSSVEQLSLPLIDVFRLLDFRGRLYAPDLANKNVEVLPMSVRKEQIAFLVDEKQNDFKLQVGELTGEKKIIEFSFKY